MRSISGIYFLFFLGIILGNPILKAQEIPEITDKEIPGFTLVRNECFNGESLWGYMNGGADIYLEYGFRKLRVEEFHSEDEHIKMEIFMMDDPMSAFGIYSLKTFKCQQNSVLTHLDCLNAYQYQLLYGDYYIQFISESGSEKAKQHLLDITTTLLKKLEFKELEMPAFYLTDSLNILLGDIKMLKGEIGIRDKANILASCLDGISNYHVYYVKQFSEDLKQTYYEIVFDSPQLINGFINKCKERNFEILVTDPNVILRFRLK